MPAFDLSLALRGSAWQEQEVRGGDGEEEKKKEEDQRGKIKPAMKTEGWERTNKCFHETFQEKHFVRCRSLLDNKRGRKRRESTLLAANRKRRETCARLMGRPAETPLTPNRAEQDGEEEHVHMIRHEAVLSVMAGTKRVHLFVI